MDNIKSNYVGTLISQINEEMLKVRIVGKIIEKDDDSVIIDDGTGAVRVRYNKDVVKELEKIEIGSITFIFGKVVKVGNDIIIFADFVREAEKFDLKKYKKILQDTTTNAND